MALIHRQLQRQIAPTVYYLLGFTILFIGERILEPGPVRTGAQVLAAMLLAGATVVRLWRAFTGPSDRQHVERWMSAAYLSGCGAIGLYAFATGFLTLLWPPLWLGSVICVLFMEISYASMAPATNIDVARVSAAAAAGLQLVCVLLTVLSLNYTASMTQRQIDLSFLKSTRPSAATRQLASSLREPVQVFAFFPSPNEVRDRVVAYFDELRQAERLRVAVLDEAVDHEAAQQAGTQGNGVVVVMRGQHRVPIRVGLEWNEAKTQLSDFDGNLQWAINKVSRNRTAYFIVGHGERDSGTDGESRGGPQVSNPTPGLMVNAEPASTDASHTFRGLHRLLRQQGYDIAGLGTDEGLGSAVPEDTTVVMLVGPRRRLLPDEITALGRYLDRGGRMMLFLDPESHLDFSELLDNYRIRFAPILLANDTAFMTRDHQPSDHANLITRSFSTHPSVMRVSRGSDRSPLLVPRSGYLEETAKGRNGGTAVYFTIHAHPRTWADRNGNFEFDAASEVRRPYTLGAALVRPAAGDRQREMRLLVYASTNMVTDALIDSFANQQLVLDGLSYLAMDEPFPVSAAPRDPMIRHSRRQDALWFYSISLGVPLMVLGGGLGSLRSRRKRVVK